MKVRNWKGTLAWLLLLVMSSCIDPYLPEVLEGPNSYLVVNGFINSNGATTIQLLRTQNLTDETLPPAERGATVVIEEQDGERIALYEQGEGIYKSADLALNPAKKYRLYIKTTDNKEYASDYVEVKQTPAISSVDWAPVDDAVQLYVSTNDPSNNTWYYRWEFEHTWNYRSPLYTDLKYDRLNDTVVYRDKSDEPIYNCWISEKSTTIELGSSIKLSKDEIDNYKLLSIPSSSEMLLFKYSVLVKQYAITREAYEYWEILKKNTESIGTLFDPLPSQLTGNIHCITNTQEPVIGYITASTIQEKRIFINSKELPEEWNLSYSSCAIDTLLLKRDKLSDFFSAGNLLPVSEVYPTNGPPVIIGYTYAYKSCVDCRTRGTNVKPAYWE